MPALPLSRICVTDERDFPLPGRGIGVEDCEGIALGILTDGKPGHSGPQIVTLSVRRFRDYPMMPANFETLLLQLDDKSDCGRFYSPFTRSLGAPQPCFEVPKTCSPTIGEPSQN